MSRKTLSAVSPIDGRYAVPCEPLQEYFSEYALFKYRVRVEVEYLIALSGLGLKTIGSLNQNDCARLRSFYTDFTMLDAEQIKTIEQTTNHDVKAVEYFVKERLAGAGLSHLLEFVHFGLTSQDINNTAVPLSVKEALGEVIFPALDEVLTAIKTMAGEWKAVPMLARTHGQPASPTTLGKELRVFAERLEVPLAELKSITHSAKFGGATGNFNAHVAAYPAVDWPSFADHFVDEVLGLRRARTTTQIEHYDHLAALFHCCSRLSTILTDFSRDVWAYVSMDYFKQKLVANEVGSSAMPHKVNPIDFENAEGNLALAIALFQFMAQKLPVSRLQRDLTDSTVLRNVGVPFAHLLIALKSLKKGISKLVLNADALQADLDAHWEVCAEALQTILRREGFEKPYETLKQLTRGHRKIGPDELEQFIDGLSLAAEVKAEMKAISPHNYLGTAAH